jgi:transposase
MSVSLPRKARYDRSAADRIQKVLEDANIKLAAVATDVLATSGRAMLEALIAGITDPEPLAELARMRLRAKIPELRLALQGRVTEHHRFLLRLHLGC